MAVHWCEFDSQTFLQKFNAALLRLVLEFSVERLQLVHHMPSPPGIMHSQTRVRRSRSGRLGLMQDRERLRVMNLWIGTVKGALLSS